MGAVVWFDEFSLEAGDSLARSIDNGLSNSVFGIVVLSPSFFRNGWPERELGGLIAREVGAQKVVIPIWYRVTRAEVLSASPTLADKLAIVATGASIDQIALDILRIIRPDLYATVPEYQKALTETIASDLGISELSLDEQQMLISEFGIIALKAATISVAEAIPSNLRPKFAKLAESGNPAALQAFLDRVVPNHEAIAKAAVAEEVRRFKAFSSEH